MKAKNILTVKQQETLTYIELYIKENGHAPLISDLQEKFKLKSTRSVTQRLDALETKGYIVRDQFKHRGLRVVNHTAGSLVSQFIRVPVLASVGCDNETIFAQDDITEYLSIEKKMIGSRDVVVMKAAGNSMIDAGVHNGDYVLIEKTQSVQTGDRVVVVVNGMAVLKKLQKIEGGFVLHAEAKGYAPIIIGSEAKIFGKLLNIIPMGIQDDVDEDEYIFVPVHE